MTPTKPPKRKQSEREDKVQEIVHNLKEKHSTTYTPMQLRIWAEMIASSLHSSTEDPPNTSMFAGGTPYKKNKEQPTPVAQALMDAATAIASALSPKVASCASPAKGIENRSKLYKQLGELQNLRSMGVLNDDEYQTEKKSIMSLLHQLKTK